MTTPTASDALTSESLTSESLTRAPAERLLALLAGATAIGFGLLAFLLDVASNPRVEWLGLKGAAAALLTLMVTLVFGALLLLGALRLESQPRDWSILVVAFSVVLLALGGTGGAIGGILGLFAGGVVLFKELRVEKRLG